MAKLSFPEVLSKTPAAAPPDLPDGAFVGILLKPQLRSVLGNITLSLMTTLFSPHHKLVDRYLSVNFPEGK